MSDSFMSFIDGLLGQMFPVGFLRRAVAEGQLRFVILGARAAGKTTLVRRIMSKPISPAYSPTVGSEDLGDFDYIYLGQSYRVRNFRDYGGDDAFWDLWDEAFTRDRPRGIIFMIDHENMDAHLRAFNYFVRFISMKDRRWLFFKGRHTQARDQLRVILFLVNKEDKWSASHAFGDFLLRFSDGFERIERLGIPFVTYGCSAMRGDNVNAAMTEFFGRLIRYPA